MATTIDQKVVEMRFDNSDFERNTKQSISTLEKLKNALHFKGASDGLEKISDSARKIKMDGLANGVQEVSAKFSALEIIGTTALVNITNSAINAGKQMVKSLTIDQVTSGWNKMGSKINSVQTLVNSTGLSIEEIDEYLDQLMWYSDETSYSFTDMTTALANMTATGGDIKKLVPMIRGMANATAYAGKGASEFSRVIYNLNQSYGAGHLQLMDWKSVQLAGVNSKQLTEELIKAGEELGTIKKGQVTIGNFNESLKDKWANTKVMELAFGRFDTLSAAAYEAVQRGYVILKDGTKREVKQASEAIALLADQYDKLGVTAFRSAQEAKTFKESIEATADATSTAWMKVFSSILGNYDDQKKIFTTFANWLYDVFVEPINSLQEVIDEAFNFKPIQEMWEKITNNKIVNAIDEVNEKIKGSTHTLEEYQNMVRRIWRGDFKNAPYRKALVEAEGYNYAVTQSLVNLTDEMAGYGQGWKVIDKLTEDDVIRLEKEFGITVEEVTDSLTGETKVVESLTDERLRSLGLSEDEIEMYRKLEKAANKYNIKVEDLINNMINRDARSLLFGKKQYDANGIEMIDPETGETLYEVYGVAQNLAAFFANILGAIGKAWRETFEEIIGVDLYMAISRLNDFTTRLREITDDENSRGMENLKDTFKGLFGILKLVTTLMNAGFKIGWTIFKTVLETLGYDVLGFTGALGRVISKITDFIVNNSYLTKGIVFLTKAISKCIIKLHDMIRPFDLLHKLVKKVGDVFHKLATIMKNWYEKTGKNVLHEFLTDLANFFKGLKETDNIPKYIFEGIIKGFKKWGGKALNGISIIFSKIFGKLNISKGDNFFEFGINCVKGLLNGLKHGAGKAIRAFADWAGNILSAFAGKLQIHSPSKKFFEFGQNIVQGLWDGITSMIGIVYTLFMTICQKIIDTVNQVDLGSILAILLAGGIVIAILKIASALKTLSGTLFDFTKNVNKVLKGFAQLEKALAAKLLMSGIKDIAIAIAIMAATVYLLSKAYKNDPEAIGHGLLMVLGLGAIVAGLIYVASLCAKLSGGNKLATAGLFAAIIATGIAMLLMTKAAKNAKDLDKDALWNLGVLAAMIAAIIFINNMFQKQFTGGSTGLGSALLGIAVCILIMGMIAKKLGEMDPTTLERGIDALWHFVGMIDTMLLLMAIVAAAGGSVKIGLGTFLGIALVFKVMAKVVKSLGKMDKKQLDQGMDALDSFSDMIDWLIVLLAALAVAQKFGGNVNGTLYGVAAMIAAMALSVKVLGEMNTGSLIQGGIAMAAMLTAIGIFIYALGKMNTKQIKNVQKTLFAVAAMIAAMAVAIWLLGNMDKEKLIQGGLAVAALMILIGALIFVSKYGKNLGKGLWPVVAAIGVLVIGLAVLSMIKWQKLLPAAGALAAVMAALALVIASTNKLKKVDTKMLIELGILIAGILVIAFSLKMLAGMDPGTLLAAAGGIAIVLATLAGVIFVLSKIKVNKDMLIAVGLMAALMLLMIPLILVIKSLSGVEGSEKTVYALAALMGVLTLMMIGLAACGAIYTATGGIGLLLAIGGLIAILGALALMIPILKGFSSIKNAEKAVLLLTIVMGSFTALLLVLGILGPLAAVGAVAMLAITGLIPIFITLLAGLGLLMEAIPEMETFIDKGATLLIKVAEILGEVIGAFVGGLLGEMSNALPTIGENLSLFAEAASGFFSWIDSLSMEILGKAGLMMGVIALMVADDFIASVSKFIKKIMKTGNALEDLGKGFSSFAVALQPFMEMVKTMPSNALSAVKDLTQVILLLTAASLLDAITKFLSFGRSDLQTFANSLPILGEGFAGFAKALNNFDESKVGLVKIGTEAIAEFSKAAKNVDQKWFGTIVDNIIKLAGGDTDLELFAKALGPLGEGFAAFVDGLSSGDTTFDENSAKIVEAGIKAISALADISEDLDEGALELIIDNIINALGGKDELELFADSLYDIGDALNEFGRAIDYVDGDGNTFNADKVNAAIDALKTISNYQSDIEDLASEDFEDSCDSLNDSLPSLGSGIANFISNMSKITTTDLEAGKQTLTVVGETLKLLKEGITRGLNETLNEWGEGSITQAISNFFQQIKNLCDISYETWSGDITNAGRTAGTNISTNVAVGVQDGLTNKGTNSSIEKIATAIAGIFTNESVRTTSINSATTLGKDIADGLINGMIADEKLQRARDAASKLYSTFDGSLRKKADINSPSKEAAKLGGYIGEGFVMGIEQYTSQVYNVGEDVADEAKRGLASTISKISNLIDSDMDTNPTIRPILDLSNVTDGISQMNSMFSNSSLTSNLGAISTGMNNRIQNGNSDVVSAIDKLGKNLGNSGTTYNINGITYDDNNNINKAVQDLVRAIEVERRV